MNNQNILREKSLTATVLMILTLSVILITAYFRINAIIEDRCLSRMEESVNTVIEEVRSKLMRDSQILNATADILSSLDNIEADTISDTLKTFTPLMETKQIRILLPDNTIVLADGTVMDGTGQFSFDDLATQGEHISNRMTSLLDGNTQILRHYVPVIKDGNTIAILYGVTVLSELPKVMNIDNIYNSSASAYIIDTETGEYIMDTWHNSLGNIKDFSAHEIKNNPNWSIDELLSGKTGYVVYRSTTTNEWLYLYYSPANINQWTIAISIPESEVFVSLFAIRKLCWVIGILLSIVILIYYLWMRQNAKATVVKAVERAVLEEKLQKAEAAERAKTIFLSNMSHDIRTPMNAIIGFTTLAQTNIHNQGRVQEYLSKIMSSSNHLLSLINDILDMSRIESGRLNIEEKECSISDIFRDMRNIIQTQMQAKQINFFMDTIDVTDEHIYCDKLHVNQVLLNLLSNAIKFTPAGGSVSLTIRQKPGAPSGQGTYEIRVKDTGIGMSPEFAQRVFEPFEREKTSTVSGIQGTGLGMAITKSIVDAMGGTIEVVTEQNKGTEFIVIFDFRLQYKNNYIENIPELEGLRTLVVDDNFTTCDSVTKMLIQIGMRSEWTMHGKEAVLRAKQAVEIGDEFYVYIIDWSLPDLSGIEVARQIRAAVGENVPIVILTAYDWSMIEDEAKAAGVTAFCNKPIFLSELQNTLLSVITKTNVADTEEDSLQPAVAELAGKRLLLVEDNELNREIAEELLSENGFVVEAAEDGTIAVDMVKNSEPGYYDLILMDVQMPIMNGYDATKAIRQLENPALANIPIVAMTANAFEEDRQTALASGMNAHVAKPINVEKLMTVLYSFLKK